MRRPDSRVVHRIARRDRARLDTLAVEILAFLGSDRARLELFFATTGLTVATLRQAAGDERFATSLIDYLAADDRLLLTFAAAHGHDPAEIEALRVALAPRDPDDP